MVKGKGKGKVVPLQVRMGPEGYNKLRYPDFMTMAQEGGRLSALRTGHLHPRKYSWYSFLLQAIKLVAVYICNELVIFL